MRGDFDADVVFGDDDTRGDQDEGRGGRCAFGLHALPDGVGGAQHDRRLDARGDGVAAFGAVGIAFEGVAAAAQQPRRSEVVDVELATSDGLFRELDAFGHEPRFQRRFAHHQRALAGLW